MSIVVKHGVPNRPSDTIIRLPLGTEILCATEGDNEVIFVYVRTTAQIDDSEAQRYRFKVIATGKPIPDDYHGVYLNTLTMNGYVWHVFYETGV